MCLPAFLYISNMPQNGLRFAIKQLQIFVHCRELMMVISLWWNVIIS
jgi:hypothetical protein